MPAGVSDEDRLLISHAADLAEQAERYRSMRFTRFLTVPQAALCRRFCEYMGLTDTAFCGGYDGAERVMCGFSGCGSPPSEEDFPAVCIRFRTRMASQLSHRHYLGTVMSVGADRPAVGDIVICEDGACVFVMESIAEAVMGIEKIGRAGVRCERLTDTSGITAQISFGEIAASVSSLRLDSITAAAVKLSRSKAAELIRQGLVTVYGVYSPDVSTVLDEGTVFSVRGHGKFIFDAVDGISKKDKYRIRIKKYL